MEPWLSARISIGTGGGSPFDDATIRESHMLCLDAENREVYSASQVEKATMDFFLDRHDMDLPARRESQPSVDFIDFSASSPIGFTISKRA